MVAGIPLNETVRNMLFDIAQIMFSKRKSTFKLKKSWCEGSIKTDWVSSGMGGIFGTIFTANLETTEGKVTVNYLVKEDENIRAEDLDWQTPERPTFSKN